jgi:hypothetical protein
MQQLVITLGMEQEPASPHKYQQVMPLQHQS